MRIEKLSRSHPVERFDCGREVLNRFLYKYALQSQQSNASQTYVALDGTDVVGYYTLVFGRVDYDAAPARLIKGLARRPVPIMLLARLAVAGARQGQKVGRGLLKDAVLRTLQAADIAGVRALAVHAKDDEARDFYRHFDFVPSPSDPLHLFLILKDVRALLR